MTLYLDLFLVSAALNLILMIELYRHDQRKISTRLKREVTEYKTTLHGLVDQLLRAKKALTLIKEFPAVAEEEAAGALKELNPFRDEY